MRIGILKTGSPPADMLEIPSYSVMIGAALGPGYRCIEFDATQTHLPKPGSAADAYFITGSAAGVHDSAVWIGALREWLKQLDPNTPLVGICFGHQIMAQTYGGVVQTSKKGWGVGLHEYEIQSQEPWMDDTRNVVLPVVHRDQVVAVPPASRTLAGSEFCCHAILGYSGRRAVSFQAHPEFELEFTEKIIDRCEQKGLIDAHRARLARLSTSKPDHRARVFGWIRRFLARRLNHQ